MHERAVQKRAELTNLDNSKCILVEFLNRDDSKGKPSRSVGFQTFLTESQQSRLGEIQRLEEEVNISWPTKTNIREATKMSRLRGDPKFQRVTVKIIKTGDFTDLRDEVNKYNARGQGSSTKDLRKHQAQTKPESNSTREAKPAKKTPTKTKECTVSDIEQMLVGCMSSDEDLEDDFPLDLTEEEDVHESRSSDYGNNAVGALISNPADTQNPPGTSGTGGSGVAQMDESSIQDELAGLRRETDQIRVEQAAKAAQERERILADELARARQEMERMRAERDAQRPGTIPVGPVAGVEQFSAFPSRNGSFPLRGIVPPVKVISRNRGVPYPLPTNYLFPEEVIRLAPKTHVEHYAAWIVPRTFDPDELAISSLYGKKIRPTDVPKPALDPNRVNAVLNLCWTLFQAKDKRFEGHFGDAARNQFKPYPRQWRRRNAREGRAD